MPEVLRIYLLSGYFGHFLYSSSGNLLSGYMSNRVKPVISETRSASEARGNKSVKSWGFAL